MHSVDRVISIIGGVNRVLLFGCRWLMICLVGLIAVDIFVGVFFRYVLNDALPWYEETAQYLLVWLVFLGSPLVLKHGGHIALGFVVERLATRLRMVCYILIYAVVFAFLVLLAYHGWGLAWLARNQQSTSVPISFFVVYLAIPLGAAIMASVSLELWLTALRGLVDPGAVRLSAADPYEDASADD